MYQALFTHDKVVVELESVEKFAAIHEVIEKSSVFDQGIDKERFESAVRLRETVQSTGLGYGVAFAHGKMPEIDHMRVALGISRQGVDYGAMDGRPVHLLFVVATNPDMHIDYLRCLARLAALVRRDGFREELLGCLCHDELQQKLHNAYRSQNPFAAACV